MQGNIKISIITATWNCANTLPDCLASVSVQNYKNREHIIIDGASSDGTINIIRNHISQIDKFISEPDKGIYDALNKGIWLSTGDVIGFLHADDLYTSKETLTYIAQAFMDPAVCAVYGDLIYVKQKDISIIARYWKSKKFNKQDLNYGWMPAHPTLYVRREWYSVIGGFDINYQISADYLSILKLFTQPQFQTKYIENVLVTMRLGGKSNKSIKSIFKKLKEDWLALRASNFTFHKALLAITCKNLRKINQLIIKQSPNFD